MNKLLIAILISVACFTTQAQSTHTVHVQVNQEIDCPVITGIEKSNLFKIFPNPAANAFTIESDLAKAKISLVDIQGKEVFSSDFVQGKLLVDVSYLKRGTYVLRVISKGKLESIKISIQ